MAVDRSARRSEALVRAGAGPRPVAIHPVVAAAGLQAGGQRQRLARLGVAAEQLQQRPRQNSAKSLVGARSTTAWNSSAACS